MKGRFLCQEKGIETAHRNLMASTDILEPILMPTASTLVSHYFVTPSSVKTSEGRTSLKRMVSDGIQV